MTAGVLDIVLRSRKKDGPVPENVVSGVQGLESNMGRKIFPLSPPGIEEACTAVTNSAVQSLD